MKWWKKALSKFLFSPNFFFENLYRWITLGLWGKEQFLRTTNGYVQQERFTLKFLKLSIPLSFPLVGNQQHGFKKPVEINNPRTEPDGHRLLWSRTNYHHGTRIFISFFICLLFWGITTFSLNFPKRKPFALFIVATELSTDTYEKQLKYCYLKGKIKFNIFF